MYLYPSDTKTPSDCMNYEVFINGTDYTEKLSRLEVIESLDEIGQVSLSLADVEGTAPTDIVENKIIKIKLDGTQFFKGLITRITYTSSTEVDIVGYDMSLKLLNRKMDRYLATNRQPTGATPSIFTDIVSENQNGTGTDIMQLGTNTSYAGLISFRCEHDNRLRGIAAIANTLGWDWWVNQDGSDNDQINIDAHRGSLTSTFTFIDGSNCSLSSKTKDCDSMVNWVTLLGYGDGINQLRTDFFATSPIYTTLSANCTATATTINCTDLSGFPAGAGYFKIGSEYVYGTKSGNNIGSAVRGTMDYGTGTVSGAVTTDSGKVWRTNEFIGKTLTISAVDYVIVSNTPTTITTKTNPPAGSQAYRIRSATFEHYKGCVVFEYDFGTRYTPASPKAASSVALYGIKESQVTRKDIIHLPTLELFASKYMIARATPVERNTIVVDEPELVILAIALGDVVTLNDTNAGFSSSQYRVVGRHLTMDMNNYEETLSYEINDKFINFINDTTDTKQNTDTLGSYMNGATNIYCVSSYENGDATHPINMRFYIPAEAVAINSVKVSFKIKNYRAYNTANASESSHTHGVGTLTATSAGGASQVDGHSNDTGGFSSLSTSFTTKLTMTFDSTHTSGCFVHVSGAASVAAGGASDIYFRLVFDGTARGGTYNDFHIEDMSGADGAVFPISMSWWIPIDTSGMTVEIQGRRDSGSSATLVNLQGYAYSVATHTHTIGGTSAAGSAHTHGITYSIYENSVSTPSVVVTAGVDGAETAVGTYTIDQSGLDITPNIASSGAWYNVKFTLNQAMRIEANAYVQVFLQSV